VLQRQARDPVVRVDVGQLHHRHESDREDPGPEYAETRACYLSRGCVPTVEHEGHPDNPIQRLALPL
jgi:hypothetical protein